MPLTRKWTAFSVRDRGDIKWTWDLFALVIRWKFLRNSFFWKKVFFLNRNASSGYGNKNSVDLEKALLKTNGRALFSYKTGFRDQTLSIIFVVNVAPLN